MYFLGQLEEAQRIATGGLELSSHYGLKAWIPTMELIEISSRAQAMNDDDVDGAVRQIRETFLRE